MKKAILFVSVLFLTSILYSQNASFVSGPEFINKNGVFKYIIGEDKTSFYVFRLGTKGSGVQNNIEKCNKKTFAVEWVKDISFEKDLGEIPGDQFQRSNIVLSRGKIYFFLSILETRKNSRSVYAKSMNCENGEVLGKAELIASEDKYGQLSLLSVAFSPDTTKALVLFNQGDGINPYYIKRVLLVELKSNKELFNKEMPVSDDKGNLQCTSVSADNKGNLSCIYSRKEGSPGIGKIAFSSTQLKTFDLNIDVNDHAYLTANILQYDDNFDYAIVTGVFVDVPCKKKKECERKEGNYFMKVDMNTSKIVTAKYEYFDDATHAIYKDMGDLSADYEKVFCFSSIIDKTNEDVYSMAVGKYSGIILVTRFDKVGKVIWTKALPRGQMLSHQGFVYAFEKGSLFFIFLDNPKNLENVPDINNFLVKKIKDQGAVTGANIVCMSISKDGALKRTVIGKDEKDKANFIPDYITNLSEQPPILNLKNRDKEQYIRFEFNK